MPLQDVFATGTRFGKLCKNCPHPEKIQFKSVKTLDSFFQFQQKMLPFLRIYNERRYNNFWTKFKNSCPTLYATSFLCTTKKYSIQSPCLHNLISTKKFIHKNACIPEFLFAISLEKSLKSFSSLINNNYAFIFQATKQ